MSKVITAKGFESAFIKTWEGWDDLDFLVMGFYRVEFTEEFAKEVGYKECGFVVIDLEKMIIEGYSDGEANSAEDSVIFSRKIELKLVP